MVSQGTIAKAKGNSEITIYEGISPGMKIEVSLEFFLSLVIIMRMREPLFSFSHRAAKTFCLLPTNLASPET